MPLEGQAPTLLQAQRTKQIPETSLSSGAGGSKLMVTTAILSGAAGIQDKMAHDAASTEGHRHWSCPEATGLCLPSTMEGPGWPWTLHSLAVLLISSSFSLFLLTLLLFPVFSLSSSHCLHLCLLSHLFSFSLCSPSSLCSRSPSLPLGQEF